MRKTSQQQNSTQIKYDGGFSKPFPLGVPRVTYPVTNMPELYFVTQRFVQVGALYQVPAFDLKHHIYPEAKFCEEVSVSEIGGGMLQFDWRFCRSEVEEIEIVQETVNFPGIKIHSLQYTEDVTVVELDEDGNRTAKTETFDRVAYDIILREPFAKRVKCIRKTNYTNILGKGKTQTQNKNKKNIGQTINYGGATATTSYDENDNLVLTIGGQSFTIPANDDGSYPITSITAGGSKLEEDSIAVEFPEQITMSTEDIFAAQKQQIAGSHGNPIDIPTNPFVADVVVNYVSEITTPSRDTYHERTKVSPQTYDNMMLIRPTEVQQLSGTVYKVTETKTEWL